MNKNLLLALAVGAFLIGGGSWSTNVAAYGWRTYNDHKIVWTSNPTMALNVVSFPAGNIYTTTFQRAMNSWNGVGGSAFRFYSGVDNDTTTNTANGVNEVYFCTACTDPGVLGVTHIRWVTYYYISNWAIHWRARYVEADIKFNVDYSWTPYTSSGQNLQDSTYEFEGVAIHELGHALGLNHENRWLATMNSRTPNGGYIGNAGLWTPLGDDRQGARYLYGNGGSEVDVVPLAVKDGGTYTDGSRIANNLVVSPTIVTRGNYMNADYTFTNLGTARATFGMCWYLTGGPSGTVQVSSGGGAWADPGWVGTYTRSLYVPTWVAPGYYRVMVRVDCYNENTEHYEGVHNDFTIPTWVNIR